MIAGPISRLGGGGGDEAAGPWAPAIGCRFGRLFRKQQPLEKAGVGEISESLAERYYRLTHRSDRAILSLVKTIILTLSAAKDIDALPRDAREQVEAGLHRYAMTGQGDVKALQGRDGYRLRIGSYRVIFDEDATTILAIYIGRRATTTYKRS